MIKLRSLKNQKKSSTDNNASQAPTMSRNTAAHIRITKDLSDMEQSKTFEVVFPDPDDLLNFKLHVTPDEGYYKGGKFTFSIKVSNSYPHEAPKVKCTNKVYHPNIDLDGNVCLNILREDWKPVLSISAVVFGLQFLLLEPNAEDPLNKDAAEVLRSNSHVFEQNVSRSLRGLTVGSVKYDRVYS